MLITIVYLLVAVAWGLQDQSTFLNVFIANGTQGAQTRWQQNSITFTCSNDAPVDNNLVVGNISYARQCHAPLYEFNTKLRFFLPRRIKRYDAQFCSTTSANVTAASPLNPLLKVGITVPESGSDLFAKRRLFSVFSDIGNYVANGFCSAVNDGASIDVPQAQAAQGAGVCSDGPQGCGCCCPPPEDKKKDFPLCMADQALRFKSAQVACHKCGSDEQCPQCQEQVYVCSCVNQGGDKTECANAWLTNQQLAADAAADAAMMKQLRQWILNEFAIDSEVYQLARNANASLALFIQGSELQANRSHIINDMITALANNTQKQFNSINASLGGLLPQFDLQQATLQALVGQQASYENATMANFAAITKMLQQIALNASQTIQGLYAQQLANDNKAHQDAAMQTATLLRRQAKRQLTTQIFQFAQQAIEAGLTPFWDPSKAGTPAAHSLTDAAGSIVLDSHLINFINGTTNAQEAHQYTVTLTCSALSILNRFFTAATWLDLAGMIGPPGCTAISSSPVASCSCWFTVQHKQCTPKAAFNWQQLTSRTAQSDYQLSSAFCQTPVVTSNWDSTTIDSLPVLNAFLGQLCATTLAPVAAACTSSCTRQIQVVSSRQGVTQNVIQPTNAAEVCAPNYYYIFNIQPERNLLFTLWTQWVFGQNLLLSDSLSLEPGFYGIPPGHITYRHFPFVVFSDNKTYECDTASFLAVGPETVPVFEATPVGFTTEIDIQGFTTPPVCDLEGCIFGTPAVSGQATVAAVPQTPFTNLLPRAGFGILGEWRVKGTPAMTSVHDAPWRMMPLNQYTRSNTLTYISQPIPDGYDLSQQTSYNELNPGSPFPTSSLLDVWLANSPLDLDALQQGGSADATEVEFVDGRCNPEPGIVLQSPCLMFEHWAIGPLTDMRQGKLFLQPDVWSYEGTAAITEGEIFQRVFEGCPEFTVVSFTNGYQQLLVHNSLPHQVTVELTVLVDLDLCPPVGTRTLVLQPSQSWNTLIFGCPTSSINLFALGSDGFTTLCAAEHNTSYAPANQGNVAYFTEDTKAAPVLAIALQAQIVATQQQSLTTLAQIFPLLAPSTTLTVPERQNNVDQLLSDWNASLTAQYNKFNTQSVQQSSTQVLTTFLLQLSALATQTTDVFARLTVIDRQISNGSGILDDFTRIQANQTARTVAAIRADQKLLSQQAQQLIDTAKEKSGLGHSATCNWCGGALSPPPNPVSKAATTATGAVNWVPGVSTVTNTATDIANPAAWICPILCALINWLLPFVIIGLVICCLIQCGPGLVSMCCNCCLSLSPK